MARLEFELCAGCLLHYGPKLGPLFRMIRKMPEFAMRCFAEIPAGPRREKFVRMFGDPSKDPG